MIYRKIFSRFGFAHFFGSSKFVQFFRRTFPSTSIEIHAMFHIWNQVGRHFLALKNQNGRFHSPKSQAFFYFDWFLVLISMYHWPFAHLLSHIWQKRSVQIFFLLIISLVCGPASATGQAFLVKIPLNTWHRHPRHHIIFIQQIYFCDAIAKCCTHITFTCWWWIHCCNIHIEYYYIKFIMQIRPFSKIEDTFMLFVVWRILYLLSL